MERNRKNAFTGKRQRRCYRTYRRIYHHTHTHFADRLYIKLMVNGAFWSKLCAGIQRLERSIITAEKCDWRPFYFRAYRDCCPSPIRRPSMDLCIGDRACHLLDDADQNHSSSCRRRPDCRHSRGVRLELFSISRAHWICHHRDPRSCCQ